MIDKRLELTPQQRKLLDVAYYFDDIFDWEDAINNLRFQSGLTKKEIISAIQIEFPNITNEYMEDIFQAIDFTNE